MAMTAHGDRCTAEKRECILRAAQMLFGRHGYAATTMKMISELAGVGFGLAAHHFGNKERLFMAAGQDMVDQLLAEVTARADAQATGLEAVEAFLRRYLDFTLDHRETFPILLRWSPFTEVAAKVDRQAIADKFGEIIEAMRQRVARGVADRSIRELEPEATAFALYALVVGAVRTRIIAPYDPPRLYAETIDFAVRSLAAVPDAGQTPRQGDRP
jgi:AcrR family transcriptional regulator